MKSIRLREKLVSVLGFEIYDKMRRYQLINDFVHLTVEKTLEDTLDLMAAEELSDLQKYMARNVDDLDEICKKHGASLEIFFTAFNRNLGEFIGKFQEKKATNESVQNILLDMREENETYFTDKGINFQKVVGRDVLDFVIASVLLMFLSGNDASLADSMDADDNSEANGAAAGKDEEIRLLYGGNFENIGVIPDFLVANIAVMKDNSIEFIGLQLLDMVVVTKEQ